MNAAEAVALARYARAGRPQQKWDEYTPDVWADALDDVRYEDAAAAVKYLVKNARYIDVEAIRDRVSKVRGERISQALAKRPPAPGELGDNAYYETRWARAWLTAVADGATVEEATNVESVRQVVDEAQRLVPQIEARAKPEPSPEVHKPEVLRQVEALRPGRNYVEAQKELKAQAAVEMERERQRQLRALEATMNASPDEAGTTWS